MDRSVRNLLLLALLCAGGVALLALLFYGSARISEFDARLTSRLLAGEGTTMERIGDFGADLAEPGPLILAYFLLVSLAIAWGSGWQLLGAGVLIVGANVTTQGLKLITAHPRVQGTLGVSYPIEIHYPSGHTTAALAVGFSLWMIAPRKWARQAAIVGLAFGFAVGAGVVIAGWHFISDVIGAAFVVGFWACLVLAALIQTGKEPDSMRRMGFEPVRSG